MSQKNARGCVMNFTTLWNWRRCTFMKKLMLAGALLLNITGLAQAADMPLKALPPPPPAFTWTGIYGGGYIGGLWAKTDSNFVFPPPSSWEQSASVGIGGGIV